MTVRKLFERTYRVSRSSVRMRWHGRNTYTSLSYLCHIMRRVRQIQYCLDHRFRANTIERTSWVDILVWQRPKVHQGISGIRNWLL